MATQPFSVTVYRVDENGEEQGNVTIQAVAMNIAENGSLFVTGRSGKPAHFTAERWAHIKVVSYKGRQNV